MSHIPALKRSTVAISIVGLLVVSLFALTAPVAAQSNTTATNTATATDSATTAAGEGTGVRAPRR